MPRAAEYRLYRVARLPASAGPRSLAAVKRVQVATEHYLTGRDDDDAALARRAAVGDRKEKVKYNCRVV